VEKSPLTSYTVARLAASYRVTDRIELFSRVENAFDEKYQESISYATPGRSIYGGVRVTIP
jgi:vitamin B12 transporter